MSVVTYPGVPNEQLSAGQLAAVAKAVGWPQADIGQFVAIEENQSGGNTAAFYPADPDGGSIGLPQINGVHDPTGWLTPQFAAEMANPAAADAEALSLFQGQGWQPWTGDASLQPPYTSLAEGNAAAAAVASTPAPTIRAELTAARSGSGPGLSWWEGLGKALYNATTPAGQVHPNPTAPSAASLAAQAVGAGGLGGSVLKYVLEGVAALAGAGLIVLAIREAGSGSDTEDQGHKARDLALAAA